MSVRGGSRQTGAHEGCDKGIFDGGGGSSAAGEPGERNILTARPNNEQTGRGVVVRKRPDVGGRKASEGSVKRGIKLASHKQYDR